MAKLPSHSVWPALRDQVDLFHEAFPGRRCAPFFRKLEEIEKRKLSFTDRNTLIKACLRLIERKKNAKTAEAFRTKLSWENEDRKRLLETLQKISLLSNDLIENIELLERDDAWFIEKDVFLLDLYRPFDALSARTCGKSVVANSLDL